MICHALLSILLLLLLLLLLELLLFLGLLLLMLLVLLLLQLLALSAAEPVLLILGVVVGDDEGNPTLAVSCSTGCNTLAGWLKVGETTDTDRVYGELKMFEKLVDGSFVGVGEEEEDSDDVVEVSAVVGLVKVVIGMGDVMDEIDERLWICCCA